MPANRLRRRRVLARYKVLEGSPTRKWAYSGHEGGFDREFLFGVAAHVSVRDGDDIDLPHMGEDRLKILPLDYSGLFGDGGGGLGRISED